MKATLDRFAELDTKTQKDSSCLSVVHALIYWPVVIILDDPIKKDVIDNCIMMHHYY